MSSIEKCLSVRLPWAALIVLDIKDAENRSWNTKFRGRFLVHAGLTIEWDAAKWLDSVGLMTKEVWDLMKFPGHVIGSAELVDCRMRPEGRWELKPKMGNLGDPCCAVPGFSDWHVPGGYGLYVRNAIACKPRPVRGRLGFFNLEVSDELA